MAKKDVMIMLVVAVVLGVGDKAKTHPAGSIVKVSDEVGDELIKANAATAYNEPTVADLGTASGDTGPQA